MQNWSGIGTISPMNQTDYIRTSEAAKILRVQGQRVRQLVQRGQLDGMVSHYSDDGRPLGYLVSRASVERRRADKATGKIRHGRPCKI